MELVELSLKSSEEVSLKLAKKINEDYDYDLVIFIAKGSYLIGKTIADYKNVPLLEIKAVRQGNSLKGKLKNVLKILPKPVKKVLRNIEVKSGIHTKNVSRKIEYNERNWNKYLDKKRIVLVDDSVDTGNSMKQCAATIKKYFKASEVKIAALNFLEKSKQVIAVDFALYNDKLLEGPWSNDSKENEQFIMEYSKYEEK